ncbi:MAG: adenosylcobinamide-GDP ribazoletransferase [Nitrososphaeraceae archaeon]
MPFDNIFSILSFLTIIPVTKKKGYDISYIAKNMYLFPIAGFIIGLGVGSLAFILYDHSQDLMLGMIVTIALIAFTGLHHTDALADLADGLMVRGSKDIKHKVMTDPRNGTAGTVVLIIYIVGIIILISNINNKFELFSLIIIAETLSKYSMVLQCYLGKSAWEGINTIFITEMKNKKKFIISTIVMVVILIIFGLGVHQVGLSLAGMLLVTSLLLLVSNRSFGGISGDVIGACNDLSRFFIYFIYVVIMGST